MKEDAMTDLFDGVTIVTRHYDAETDAGFVYSSWRNSSFYLKASVDAGDPSSFFSEQTRRIKEILRFADVRVACYEDSPLVIVGYSVYTGTHLDWIYVKADFRGRGIGRLLTPKNLASATLEATRIGKIIAMKKNIPLKENAHGHGNEENRQTGSAVAPAGASSAICGEEDEAGD